MKLIVAGSRGFDDYQLMVRSINSFRATHPRVTDIVSGTARGADKLGERYAEEHNMNIVSMPADWNTHGRSAGYKRNEEMAKVSDACICFWDGVSRGTSHMIDLAKEYDLDLEVVNY